MKILYLKCKKRKSLKGHLTVLVNTDLKQNAFNMIDLTGTASQLIIKDVSQLWNDSSDGIFCSLASTELLNRQSTPLQC